MPDMALSDVRVLDFTHYVAGPYCTKLLADYGADVIKVERPDGGDGARRLGPFPDGEPHLERSGLFLHLNTNKRSVTLDLKSGAGQRIARELASDCDVVVENFRPGTMERFGLDYESLKSVKPGLVMTSISDFGQRGPYRDYRGSDIVFYGMGGEMYSTGLEDREPINVGTYVILYQAGSTAAVGTMGTLLASRGQGIGQQVDVSIMETQVASMDRRMTALLGYQYTGEITPRIPMSSVGYPIGVYPCSDGYVTFMGGNVYFPRVVRMLGEPEFLKDPKWHEPDAQSDPALKYEFDEQFIPWCMERTRAEAWQAAQEARVLSGPLNEMKDVSTDPHFEERGVFVEIEHPEAGLLKYPGRPFGMSESPWSVRRPAPLLGEHNVEVLRELGYEDDDVGRLLAQGVIGGG